MDNIQEDKDDSQDSFKTDNGSPRKLHDTDLEVDR